MSATQAGYSGTPLVRKVGVKVGHRLVLCAAPAGWVIPDLPAGVTTSDLPAPPAVEAGASSPGASSPGAPPSNAALPGAAGSGGAGPGAEPADVVIAFARTPADLAAAVAGFGQAIHPAGALWIAWPRRAAGHVSDVTENLIREVALPTGLVDTKVAALDTDWSGLKLVWRKELR